MQLDFLRTYNMDEDIDNLVAKLLIEIDYDIYKELYVECDSDTLPLRKRLCKIIKDWSIRT